MDHDIFVCKCSVLQPVLQQLQSRKEPKLIRAREKNAGLFTSIFETMVFAKMTTRATTTKSTCEIGFRFAAKSGLGLPEIMEARSRFTSRVTSPCHRWREKPVSETQ